MGRASRTKRERRMAPVNTVEAVEAVEAVLPPEWDGHDHNAEIGYVREVRGCVEPTTWSPTGAGLVGAMDVLMHVRDYVLTGPDNDEYRDAAELADEAIDLLAEFADQLAGPDDDIQTWHLREHHS